ncbi:actin cytoskeleton-regulatory complex protein PAN1-like isoform X2 [Daphnia pulex]|uniref:actin cytoskeleton-regulatory complex protein PAN1-like isoform X2 n=1 Tax=Daphnia pulex TaxID=6669 RepID=UPI001EDE4877|nr:actin cytoskeleton-regulatory complex protein PAN1-like isoform X2 [Daphnia pulex]
MVKIQVLALLAIVFCFALQSQASPLALREENDGEETDREFEDAFEDAFEAALNEEQARQLENVEEARNFEEDDDEVARTLRQIADTATDEEFENAFAAALQKRVARNFKNFENVEEARNFEDDDDEVARALREIADTATDEEFENAFAAAMQKKEARNFEEEMDLSEDDQSEYERQISADFDITPPKEYEVRQVPAPVVPVAVVPAPEVPAPVVPAPEVPAPVVPAPEVPAPVVPAPEVPAPVVPAPVVPAPVVPAPVVPAPAPSGKPRTTEPLRLSQLIVRPMLIKRCQGATNYSVGHCAKYLSCGRQLFRGAVRTCESGQLFDAVLKKCNDAEKVDCNIRT